MDDEEVQVPMIPWVRNVVSGPAIISTPKCVLLPNLDVKIRDLRDSKLENQCGNN